MENSGSYQSILIYIPYFTPNPSTLSSKIEGVSKNKMWSKKHRLQTVWGLEVGKSFNDSDSE